MLEKYEICCGLFHGFDWTAWKTGTPVQRLALLPPAQEHILEQDDGKNRCVTAVTELSKAFALAVLRSSRHAPRIPTPPPSAPGDVLKKLCHVARKKNGIGNASCLHAPVQPKPVM